MLNIERILATDFLWGKTQKDIKREREKKFISRVELSFEKNSMRIYLKDSKIVVISSVQFRNRLKQVVSNKSHANSFLLFRRIRFALRSSKRMWHVLEALINRCNFLISLNAYARHTSFSMCVSQFLRNPVRRYCATASVIYAALSAKLLNCRISLRHCVRISATIFSLRTAFTYHERVQYVKERGRTLWFPYSRRQIGKRKTEITLRRERIKCCSNIFASTSARYILTFFVL